MAINKPAIIEAVYQGAGQDAKNLIPPTDVVLGRRSSRPTPYDPEGAKKLLATTPASPTSMLDLWAMPVSRPYNPNAQRVAELEVQADYGPLIGVKANIVSYEWTEYRDARQGSDRRGALQLGWTGDNGDPDNFLAFLLPLLGISYDRTTPAGATTSSKPLSRRASATKVSDHGRAHRALQQGPGTSSKAEEPGLNAGATRQGVHADEQERSGLHAWIRSASTASTASTSPSN